MVYWFHWSAPKTEVLISDMQGKGKLNALCRFIYLHDNKFPLTKLAVHLTDDNAFWHSYWTRNSLLWRDQAVNSAKVDSDRQEIDLSLKLEVLAEDGTSSCSWLITKIRSSSLLREIWWSIWRCSLRREDHVKAR